MNSSLDSIVKSYSTFLEVKYPDNFRAFNTRLNSDPESARAEAFVFSMLRDQFHSAIVNEDPSIGGFDFLCSYGELEIAVEVKSLGASTMERHTGISEAQLNSPQWFNLMTAKLRNVVSEKPVK